MSAQEQGLCPRCQLRARGGLTPQELSRLAVAPTEEPSPRDPRVSEAEAVRDEARAVYDGLDEAHRACLQDSYRADVYGLGTMADRRRLVEATNGAAEDRDLAWRRVVQANEALRLVLLETQYEGRVELDA